MRPATAGAAAGEQLEAGWRPGGTEDDGPGRAEDEVQQLKTADVQRKLAIQSTSRTHSCVES